MSSSSSGSQSDTQVEPWLSTDKVLLLDTKAKKEKFSPELIVFGITASTEMGAFC